MKLDINRKKIENSQIYEITHMIAWVLQIRYQKLENTSKKKTKIEIMKIYSTHTQKRNSTKVEVYSNTCLHQKRAVYQCNPIQRWVCKIKKNHKMNKLDPKLGNNVIGR